MLHDRDPKGWLIRVGFDQLNPGLTGGYQRPGPCYMVVNPIEGPAPPAYYKSADLGGGAVGLYPSQS